MVRSQSIARASAGLEINRRFPKCACDATSHSAPLSRRNTAARNASIRQHKTSDARPARITSPPIQNSRSTAPTPAEPPPLRSTDTGRASAARSCSARTTTAAMRASTAPANVRSRREGFASHAPQGRANANVHRHLTLYWRFGFLAGGRTTNENQPEEYLEPTTKADVGGSGATTNHSAESPFSSETVGSANSVAFTFGSGGRTHTAHRLTTSCRCRQAQARRATGPAMHKQHACNATPRRPIRLHRCTLPCDNRTHGTRPRTNTEASTEAERLRGSQLP